MNLEFDYKVYDLENLLDNNEFLHLSNLINDFTINLNEIKSALGFLQWSDNVQNTIKDIDLLRYNKIDSNYQITYDDFKFLKNLNDEFGFNDNDYFNFFLTHPIQCLKDNGIYPILTNVYEKILFDLFGKKKAENEFSAQ